MSHATHILRVCSYLDENAAQTMNFFLSIMLLLPPTNAKQKEPKLILFSTSCFLLQPPQKTCPAYSLNFQEDNTKELITSQDKKTKKANF